MLDFTKHITVAVETSRGWFAASVAHASSISGSWVFQVREVLGDDPTYVVSSFVVSEDVTEDDIRLRVREFVDGPRQWIDVKTLDIGTIQSTVEIDTN